MEAEHETTTNTRTSKSKKTTARSETLHMAPTAGAAAAIATSTAAAQEESSDSENFDQYLLTELANTGATRASQVDWESIRLDNARERWMELLDEFETENGGDGGELSLSEMAQAILDRKASAQRAAETVEAVDLPAITL